MCDQAAVNIGLYGIMQDHIGLMLAVDAKQLHQEAHVPKGIAAGGIEAQGELLVELWFDAALIGVGARSSQQGVALLFEMYHQGTAKVV